MGEIALLATATHERADYSSAAAALALALDQRGHRVLVLDLLPAVHAAHTALGLPGEAKGLEWVLFGNAAYSEMLARGAGRPNLHVLTYQGGARSRLPAEPLKRLCGQAARSYDVVLIACALDQGPWISDLEEGARASVLLVPADQSTAFAIGAQLPAGEQPRPVLVTEVPPEVGAGDPSHPDSIAAAVGGPLLGALPTAPEGGVDPGPAEGIAERLLAQLRLPAQRERTAPAEPVPLIPRNNATGAGPSPFPPAPLIRERYDAPPPAPLRPVALPQAPPASPAAPPPPAWPAPATPSAAWPAPAAPTPPAVDGPPGELNQVLDEVKTVWKLKRNLTEGRAQLEMSEAEYAAGMDRLTTVLQLDNGEPVGRDEIANLARRLSDLKTIILRLRQDLPRTEQEYRSLFLTLKDTLSY